jgi:hypothetical protein
MASELNPAAGHHLPVFITPPGETDVLLVFTLVVLIVSVIAIGVFYFRLHALPEHIAHRTTKIQYELVCILALISLFTHNHIYWIAGLLLAFIELPDFTTPLTRMADSLAKMAGVRRRPAKIEELPPITATPIPSQEDATRKKGPTAEKVKDLSHA